MLTPFLGNEELRARISTAITRGRLPQVLLVTGPIGSGKQRFGLWIAQRLLCSAVSQNEPCGNCSGCLKVLSLAHPDVHWLIPVARPKAGDPDKQVEEVGDALGELYVERRANPQWTTPDGMSSHGIASARWLQRKNALMAAEGGWRISIVGNAERLVPQESSPEAANALLKLFEEPPAKSLFVLTTPTAGQVLPTIRSRAVPVRMMSASAARTTSVNSRSVDAAREYLRAARGGDATAMARALRQQPWQARGEFTELLDALAELLSAEARQSVENGAIDQAHDAYTNVQHVLAAREKAQGNVNPQLILATLADQLNGVVTV